MTEPLLRQLLDTVWMDDESNGDGGDRVSARDLAGAIWLAPYLTSLEADPRVLQRRDRARATPEQQPHPDPASETDDANGADVSLSATGDAATDRNGLPVRIPAVPALSDSLAIGRALRPLKQRVPSRGPGVLDEQATATASAESEVCLPVMRPATERWLQLDIVVDVSATMAIWQQTIRELATLMEHHGAFRVVRRWRLDGDTADPALLGTDGSAGSPRELVDPTGRRVMLVITDGIGAAWHSGKAEALLAQWREFNLVAIVDVLPRRLWHRTGLVPVPVTVRRNPFGRGAGALSIQSRAVPLPRGRGSGTLLISLDTDGLGLWAALVAGSTPGSVPAMAAFGRPPTAPKAVTSPRWLPPEQQVDQFQATVSTAAFELACWLSPSALSLPVMRLVQLAIMPGSTTSDLAELLLSGLLRRLAPTSADEHPDHIRYDFAPGIREVLLDHLTRTEILKVQRLLRAVSEVIDVRFGGGLDFPAVLATGSPTGTPTATIGAAAGAFGRLAPAALRRLGFAALPPDQTAPTPAPSPEPVTVHEPTPDRDPVSVTTGDGSELRSPSHPIFCVSYARTPGSTVDRGVREFFIDLTSSVAELFGLPPGQDPGFVDQSAEGGARWRSEHLRAIGTCQVFVALLSEPYVRRGGGWVMEWDLFSRRKVTHRMDRHSPDQPDASNILPVLWTPMQGPVPGPVAEIDLFQPIGLPDPSFVDLYLDNGILGLRRMTPNYAYQAIVWKLALQMQRAYHTHWVEPSVLADTHGLRRSFTAQW